MAVKVEMNPAIKIELLGLNNAKKLHAREQNTVAGADFTLPDTVKAILLANSGSVFTITDVKVAGSKARQKTQTKSDGGTFTVPTGHFDIVCIVTATIDKVAEPVKFKTTVGEIANCDEKGQIVIIAQLLGQKTVVDPETKVESIVPNTGNLWVHSNNPATPEKQMAFIGAIQAAQQTAQAAQKPTATAPKA